METELTRCSPRKAVYIGLGITRVVHTPFPSVGGPNGPTERAQSASRLKQMEISPKTDVDTDRAQNRVFFRGAFARRHRLHCFGWRGPGFCMGT